MLPSWIGRFCMRGDTHPPAGNTAATPPAQLPTTARSATHRLTDVQTNCAIHKCHLCLLVLLSTVPTTMHHDTIPPGQLQVSEELSPIATLGECAPMFRESTTITATTTTTAPRNSLSAFTGTDIRFLAPRSRARAHTHTHTHTHYHVRTLRYRTFFRHR